MLLRWPIVCLVVVAAAVGLPACASSDDELQDSGDVSLVRASQATGKAGSARFRMETEIEGQDIEATGYMDMRSGDMSMTMRIPSAGDIKVVMVDLIEYLRVPDGEAPDGLELDPGQRWLKIDLRKLSGIEGLDLQGLTGGNASDPQQWIRQMAAVGSVETVGHETVDGVETTHVKAILDLDKVADVLPESERAAARKTMDEMIDAMGTSEIPIEAWIDDDDLIRHLTETLPMPDGDMTVDMELFDFGAHETIEAPPADEVKDMTELVRSGALDGG